MSDKKIQVTLSGANQEFAYIALPGHPVESKAGVVARMVRLDQVIEGYEGPMVNLDFDAAGVLIGIEVLAKVQIAAPWLLERAMLDRKVTSLDEIVSGVGDTLSQAVRYELPSGVVVTRIFDGDEANPRTCQWRISAQSESEVAAILSRLLELLKLRGVTTKPPRLAGLICYLSDCGPW